MAGAWEVPVHLAVTFHPQHRLIFSPLVGYPVAMESKNPPDGYLRNYTGVQSESGFTKVSRHQGSEKISPAGLI